MVMLIYRQIEPDDYFDLEHGVEWTPDNGVTWVCAFGGSSNAQAARTFEASGRGDKENFRVPAQISSIEDEDLFIAGNGIEFWFDQEWTPIEKFWTLSVLLNVTYGALRAKNLPDNSLEESNFQVDVAKTARTAPRVHRGIRDDDLMQGAETVEYFSSGRWHLWCPSSSLYKGCTYLRFSNSQERADSLRPRYRVRVGVHAANIDPDAVEVIPVSAPIVVKETTWHCASCNKRNNVGSRCYWCTRDELGTKWL